MIFSKPYFMKLEDRLKSFGTGLAVISAAAVLFSVDIKSNFWTTHEWLRYSSGIILCFLFLLLLFQDWVFKLYREKVMRKRNLSDTVVSKKINIIDIQDIAGHKATYFQKAHFSNIKNGNYILRLVADPDNKESWINLHELQLANCSAKPDMSKKAVKLYFTDKIEELNKSKSLYPVEKYFYFSAELVDCFTHNEGDCWNVTTFNYVKEFELNIHFPPGRKVDEVNIYRKDEGKEILLDAANPILINRMGRDSIYLFITNFDQRDKFIVKWSYKKTKSGMNEN
jgi:hypothetical protein